jgi:cytochrome c-type biogenesis protein CcmF
MMIPIFGYLTLALGFLLAIYGLITMIWGMVLKSIAWRESARLALLLIFPLTSLSLIAMLILLVDNRFDVAYVYNVTNLNMPLYLRLTALWGGQSGSLLFWSWLLSGFSMGFTLRERGKAQDIFPWACLILLGVLGFFLAMNLFVDNPFESFWYLEDGGWTIAMFRPSGGWALLPQDGQGLNPLLRHMGMILHPPALYLGFVGFTIPYALAIGSLAVGGKDRRWVEIAQPWMLFAWVFLSLGLVLGMRWAYDVLGWGGYWGWDPVEISALLPWLSGTALLHTSLLQRKRDGYKRWNVFLIILTFSLVVFSVFSTRSGVLASVHSFAQSTIGPFLFGLLAVVFVGSMGLLIFRWRSLGGSYLTEFEFSWEVLTLFTNLVLLSILAVCLLGVILPTVSEMLTGATITVGPAWYERITGPLFLLLMLLMGICPLAAWSGMAINKHKNRLLFLFSVSLLIPLLSWLLGVRNAYALIALWLSGMAGLVILWEFVQSVRKELTQKHRFFKALWIPIRKSHRRYGGLIVHLGIVLMSLGIIGLEGLQKETQVTLSVGEETSLSGYQFTFEGLETYAFDDERLITEAKLDVSRKGQVLSVLNPQRQIYLNMNQAYSQPGLKSNLAVDLYAILVDWNGESEATFTLFVTPLANWLWIGTGVLTFGTVVAALPERKNRSFNITELKKNEKKPTNLIK